MRWTPSRLSGPAASRALTVLGAALLLAAAVFVWADRSFFDAEGFSARATTAAKQDAVQSRLADIVSARLIEGRPDLQAAEPLINAAAEWVLASSRFRDTIEDATTLLHTQLFRNDDERLVLQLGGIADEIRAVLALLAPDVAAELPSLDTIDADLAGAGDYRARLLSIAERVDFMAFVLPVMALVSFVAAVVVPGRRSAALREVGVATAAVALLLLVAILAGRILLVETVREPENVEAVKAVWVAFTGPLQDMAWLFLAIAGLVYLSGRWSSH